MNIKGYTNATQLKAENIVGKNKDIRKSNNNQKLAYFYINLIVMIGISALCGNAAILITGLTGVFITMICAEGLPQKYYGYMFVIVMVMMIYLMVHYYGLIEEYGIPYYAGDDEHFESWGKYLYEHEVFTFGKLKNVVFTNQGNARGYPLLLSWIELLSLGHYHTVMPRILNLYLWLSLSILTLKLLRLRISNSKIEKVMFISLALFPNGIFISSFVYRDTVMEFLIIVIVYNMIMLMTYKRRSCYLLHKIMNIIIIILAGYYLAYIRSTSLYICMLLGILIYMDKYKDMSQKRKILLYSLIGIALVGLVMYFDLPDMYLRYSRKYTSYLLSQEYGLSSRIFSMPIFPYGWIFRCLYGLTVPFPAGLLSLEYYSKPFFALSNAVVYLGTFYQIFMIPYLIKASIKKNVNAWMYLVVYASIVLTTFTFRHFIMPLPFFALTVAEEYKDTNRKKRIKYFVFIIVGLMLMALLYLMLKIF